MTLHYTTDSFQSIIINYMIKNNGLLNPLKPVYLKYADARERH